MPDLALLRRDVRAFSQAVGEPLEPWQAESIQERSREIAVVGPRRSGKKRAAVLAAVHHCYSGPERHALVIASAEEGAKRFVAMARRIVTRSPLLKASVVDEQAQKLVFSNGSTLRCVAATDAAVRGITASLVIADEAALISDEVLLGAARPIIASEPHGRFLMISSALRAGGAFYDAVRRGEAGSGHTVTFTWALTDAWWISALRFHDLRHTCVALLVEQGAHPKLIQNRLGHSSITVTLDTYGGVFPSMEAQLADALEVAFEAPASNVTPLHRPQASQADGAGVARLSAGQEG